MRRIATSLTRPSPFPSTRYFPFRPSHRCFSQLNNNSHNNKSLLSPLLTRSLNELDPEIHNIIEHEKARQRDSLALIPSENFTSTAVLQALGSVMSNKYSEGYPDKRYYGGNQFIDAAEKLCQKRALELYKLNSEQWGVNVQPLSGSPANFYSYTAILQPHERIMSLDLPSGGHLSHGYAVPNKKISAVSVYFEVLPYHVNSEGIIDYDTLEKNAVIYRPKLIVTGASAYARHIDYKRMRQIADKVGAYLLVDMAHISGLVAGGVMPSPFHYADIVTTTTHKSLRGPRGAMIFFRRGVRSVDAKTGQPIHFDLEDRVNAAVFPMHQGGPHNHTIAALAVALKQANTPQFKQYAQQVLDNNQVLVEYFKQQGYKIVSDGSDNHLLLMDLRPFKLNGAKVEKLFDRLNIAINKNTVPGDVSAMNPGGIRLGSPALTTRGLKQDDFKQVAQFIHQGIQLAVRLQAQAKSNKMSDYVVHLDQVENSDAELFELKQRVKQFARQFSTVGFDEDTCKYKD